MPMTYNVPGIYIEEKSGSRPIAGVGTAMPAFIGLTEHCPLDKVGKPVFVASWTQYQQDFGGFVKLPKGESQEEESFIYLPFAVYGYFQNGGTACYVLSLAACRVAMPMLTSSNTGTLKLTPKPDAPADKSVEVEVTNVSKPGTPAEKAGTPAEKAGAPDEQFKIIIRFQGQKDEEKGQEFDNLTMDNVAQKLINAQFVQVDVLVGKGSLLDRRPKNDKYTLAVPYTKALALKMDEFEGDPAKREGIGALAEIDEITMLVCPDLMSLHRQKKLTDDDVVAVQKAMLDHCATMKDRFAILDAPLEKNVTEVATYRGNLGQESGRYGALYYPWIKVANPAAKNGSDQSILIPPSGHIAGIYARVDQERGVHKAPANHVVRGAVGLERQVIDSEQGTLNPQGINCIRTFPGRGILVWGARTLAEESSEWRYINVRRLFNYVEESILEGTQWVVFEPNDVDLWERVKRTITAFLTRVWRSGALVGATAEEAFYVKCDADLNPERVRDAGQLFVEVGLAPVKPAEFIIFSFSQMSAGGSITE